MLTALLTGTLTGKEKMVAGWSGSRRPFYERRCQRLKSKDVSSENGVGTREIFSLAWLSIELMF
jgi:hypothetical protein